MGTRLYSIKFYPDSDQIMSRIPWCQWIYKDRVESEVYEPTLSELIEACGDIDIEIIGSPTKDMKRAGSRPSHFKESPARDKLLK